MSESTSNEQSEKIIPAQYVTEEDVKYVIKEWRKGLGVRRKDWSVLARKALHSFVFDLVIPNMNEKLEINEVWESDEVGNPKTSQQEYYDAIMGSFDKEKRAMIEQTGEMLARRTVDRVLTKGQVRGVVGQEITGSGTVAKPIVPGGDILSAAARGLDLKEDVREDIKSTGMSGENNPVTWGAPVLKDWGNRGGGQRKKSGIPLPPPDLPAGEDLGKLARGSSSDKIEDVDKGEQN